jgi:hypothetical protein
MDWEKKNFSYVTLAKETKKQGFLNQRLGLKSTGVSEKSWEAAKQEIEILLNYNKHYLNPIDMTFRIKAIIDYNTKVGQKTR